MDKYVINGLFLTQQIGGIQRYAYEMTKSLDDFVEDKKLCLVTPEIYNGTTKLFRNIQIIKYGKRKGLIWEQTDLRRFLKESDSLCVNFANVTPLYVKPGITAIHDLMFQLFPEWFTTIRNKMSCIWHTYQASYALKHEKYIICPSNFTKEVLEKEYPCSKGKVVVVSASWQHVTKFQGNKNWDQEYPFLKKKEFYFSMATRSKNKNGQWIAEAARKNPNSVFVVAGRSYEPEGFDIPSNMYVLGYISDASACSLMKNCKAFICPSFYEGFGSPPLEALALGAKIIVSNQSALPEVFEKAAHYIDPYDTDVDLDKLLKEPLEDPDTVLRKYNWRDSAKVLYDLMYSKG